MFQKLLVDSLQITHGRECFIDWYVGQVYFGGALQATFNSFWALHGGLFTLV